MTQIDEAKKIAILLREKRSWNEIGNILNCHPEKARSIFRRYQSDLTGEVSALSFFDKQIEEDMIYYRRAIPYLEEINAMEKKDKYGAYLVISDLHGQFLNRKALKYAILQAKELGIKKVIVNGDLFHADCISKFGCSRDEILKEEVEIVSDILTVLAECFDKCIIVEGNHDKRLNKIIVNSVPNGVKCFVNDISAIGKTIELLSTEVKNKIYFTHCNELKLGSVIFAHPDHFSSISGRTVMDLIDTYLPAHRNLTGVVIGHTHYDFKKCYKGIAAIETGCLSYEPDYRRGAIKRKDIWVTSYAIVKIDESGDIDYNNSNVYLIPEV